MIPAILIILIVHIIIAIRWMLIKILSAVINDWERIKVIVLGGCCLDINIIRKNKQKSRCCGTLDVRIFAGQDKRLPPRWQEPYFLFKRNDQLDKLEFGGESPLPIRARCSMFRYCPDPLGIVTAKQLNKLEFI